jgi:tRNA(adenine34) deaminase
MFSERDEFWMRHALELAKLAEQNGEVPVGAVLVANDEMLGEGFNLPIAQCDPSSHAEILALRNAAKKINNYRLINSTLYVTLEPCLMCTGALVHARIERLVFGASDTKVGAVTSVFQILDSDKLNHRVQYAGGLLAAECGNLLSEFFRARRTKKEG